MAETEDIKKLSVRERLVATGKIAATTYRAAPMAVWLQMTGSIISAVFPIITAYFAAATTTSLADAYAGKAGAGQQAIEYVVITAALGIFSFAWSSISNYITEMMEYRIDAAVSDQMYEQFLSLAFWRYDDKETADLYEKAMRFSQLFPRLFRQLSGIATDFFTMIAGMLALIFVSWWLGLIAIIAIVPGVIIQIRLTRMQTSHWKKNIQPRRTVSWIEYGMMQPDKIAELRLYGLVRSLLDLRQAMRDKDQKARIELERRFVWVRVGADILESIVQLIALIWVAVQVITRRQPIGQFIYVQQVVSRAIGGAKSFMTNLSSIDEDLANLFDYQKFMALPAGSTGDHVVTTVPDEITVSNLSFHYPLAEKNVLRNVSFTIKKNQHIAIVGENGAGKTTLVKILSGLYEPTDGVVQVDGVPLQKIDIVSWHKMLGVLSQDFIKYDFANARDNIAYGDISARPTERRIENAIVSAEAAFLHKLPAGLDNYVDQWMEDDDGHKGQDLSGGQWQRLALARNFYRDAPIVILDEPTSAIDALAESRIFNRLFAEENRTIIAISHRLTTIKKADVIYMLKDGKIVEQGTYDELKKLNGEFVTMFKSQM